MELQQQQKDIQHGVSPNPSYPQKIKNVKGKNLFSALKAVTDSNNSSTYITQDGKWIRFVTGGDRFYFYPLGIEENTQYTFTTIIKNGNSLNNIIITAFYTDGTSADLVSKNNINDTSEYTLIGITQPGKTLSYLRSGWTTGNEAFIKIEGTQLEKGRSSTYFVPYNNIGVKVQNKNLFDATAFEAGLVTGKILNDNGVEISDNDSTYSKYLISVKANQPYYIKGAFQRLYTYDNNKILISRGNSYGTIGINASFTFAQDGYIGFQIFNRSWRDDKGQEQVEQSSVATSYIAYAEQTKYFTLEEGQFLAEGDYLADDGIHKVWQKVDLSDLTWSTYATNKYKSNEISNIEKPETVYIVGNIYATKYRARMQNGSFENGDIGITQNKEILVCDITGTPSGIAQYKLAEEIVIPYTQTQQLQYEAFSNFKTYEDVTHIDTDGDLAPIVKVDYYKKK